MHKYFINLNDWIQIKVSGPEVMDYLNGIITKDLENLEKNQFVRSAFLTVNAKIRSIFWLIKKEDSILIFCPSAMKNNLVEDLLKYKLSMNVKLEDLSKDTDPLFLISDSNSKIPGLSFNNFGFTFVNSNEKPVGKELEYKEFQAMLVENGISPPEIMMSENPYEVGINDAITLEKGCFLGQEPISRMFNRGNPRKFLYLFQILEDPRDDKIIVKQENVGQILLQIPSKNGYNAIGFLKRQLNEFSNLMIGKVQLKVVRKIGEYPKNSREIT